MIDFDAIMSHNRLEAYAEERERDDLLSFDEAEDNDEADDAEEAMLEEYYGMLDYN